MTKEMTIEDKIIAAYMQYLLENEQVPKSVFKFAAFAEITEEEFYACFGSINAIKPVIWKKFFLNTETMLQENESYEAMTNREKMLTFFFTFFDLLTLNRSYILLAIQEDTHVFKNLEQLKFLRSEFKTFVKALVASDNEGANAKFVKKSPELIAEGAWMQLLFLLKFWLKDNSSGFDKTDVAIEKSVNTIFDVFDNTPLDSIIDFGKFLFKEVKSTI